MIPLEGVDVGSNGVSSVVDSGGSSERPAVAPYTRTISPNAEAVLNWGVRGSPRDDEDGGSSHDDPEAACGAGCIRGGVVGGLIDLVQGIAGDGLSPALKNGGSYPISCSPSSVGTNVGSDNGTTTGGGVLTSAQLAQNQGSSSLPSSDVL